MVAELLEQGHSYETAARALGLPPGLVFMLATGLPADDGDAPAGRSQQLVNPPLFDPTAPKSVRRWVDDRARRELTQAR